MKVCLIGLARVLRLMFIMRDSGGEIVYSVPIPNILTALLRYVVRFGFSLFFSLSLVCWLIRVSFVVRTEYIYIFCFAACWLYWLASLFG